MEVIAQGDIWWIDLPEPIGSGPGYRRPMLVIQGNKLNSSRIDTVICIPLTTNRYWAEAPGKRAASREAYWITR